MNLAHSRNGRIVNTNVRPGSPRRMREVSVMCREELLCIVICPTVCSRACQAMEGATGLKRILDCGGCHCEFVFG